MNNLDEYDGLQLKLIASSNQDANITVLNPQTNWSQTFSVQSGIIAEMIVPAEQTYTNASEVISPRGVKVTSSAPISLYASNYSPHSYDATNILPTTALGCNYIFQVYEDDSYPKEFAIVATKDHTIVTITPHARTINGKIKDVPFQVTLNAGETYQVMSSEKGEDFSGTKIESNKPIAVFAGHSCIDIPNGWCDHIVEQLMPVSMWGKQFVVTKTSEQEGNHIIVSAAKDNTQVKVNGIVETTISAFESYVFRLTDNSAFIESSEPIECILYVEGARYNKMVGDPSSVLITPVEQQIQRLTFATFQSDISRTHYVNIVTTTAGAASLLLDGVPIAAQFNPVSGNPSYQYAQVNIEHGTHTITSSKDGFSGYVYGLGWCESYAYSIGSAIINFNAGILVDDVPHEDLVYDENRCYKKGIEFSPNVSVAYESIQWKFGDGTTSNLPILTHNFPSAGTYSIQMIITSGTVRDTARTTLVLKDIYNDTINADICEGNTYTLNGISYNTSGEYTQVLNSEAGCDSIVTLKLNVHNSYFAQEEQIINAGSSYRWQNNWYRDAGVYRCTIPTINGCDSIFELKLNVVDSYTEIYDTICWKPYYEFHGYSFPLPPVDGYESQDYIDYTLEFRDKVECVSYILNLAISTIADGTYITNDTIQFGTPYTWIGEQYTETGTFTKTISSGYECTQEYILNLVVLPFPFVKTEATLCTDAPYEFRGKTYTEPGVYRDTAFTDAGIVGIYQLTLTDSRTYENMYITTTGSYTLNGQTYTESGTYVQKLTNAAGCDSILTLYLGIDENCVITSQESVVLCPGNSFIWNNQTVDEAKEYAYQTTSLSGCDSVAILHVTLGSIKQKNLSIEICEGDYYRYGSDKLSEARDYTYTYTSAEGCDSVVTITLTHKETYVRTLKDTIKQGQTYTWNGDVYDVSGSYIKGYVADNNCDSVVTLDLFVAEPVYHEFFESTCGKPYIWDGRTYSESGDYQYTYTSHIKGDSIVTLHLSILSHSDSIEIVTICHGESHTWHGNTYSTSITKTITIDNAVGCDSVCTLQLTVVPELTGDTSATFCNGAPFVWHDNQYPIGGDYQYTYTSKVAPYCDSIVTLSLTQLEPTDSIETATLCAGGSYIWHGRTYTTSTNETETITNSVGCDSVCTLNLTILPVLTGTTTATITEGATYIWNGQPYGSEGEYTQTLTTDDGCDSIVTLHLTVNPLIYDILMRAQCADDPFVEFELQADDGLIHQLQFAFSQKALDQHFPDTTVTITTSLIQIPNSARAGIYDVAISPLFDQQLLDTRNYQFTLLYPSSVLDQHWDDFIGVLTNPYNGGYDFVGFQWYKSGSPITGENHSYLYQPLEMGSPYSAMLEESDGTKLMTCEIIATHQTEISLYPTLLQPNQIIRLHSSEDVTIWLYDSLGKLLYTNSFERGDSQFAAPQDHGIYIVKIQQTGEQGKSETKKLIVR